MMRRINRRSTRPDMLQAIGTIVFAVLAYTALALTAGRLPAAYASGFAFLAPLIGLAAAAWAFAPKRRRD